MSMKSKLTPWASVARNGQMENSKRTRDVALYTGNEGEAEKPNEPESEWSRTPPPAKNKRTRRVVGYTGINASSENETNPSRRSPMKCDRSPLIRSRMHKSP